jgi:integrase
MKFALYQAGSLRVLKRVRGSSIWQFRYRQTAINGQRRQRSIIVGTTEEYPTDAEARKKLQGLLLSMNASARTGRVTVNDLIDRFIYDEHLVEVEAGKMAGPGILHYSTAKGYLNILNRYLRPRWGDMRLTDVRPAAVQDWFNRLSVAPKSRAHIRGLMRRLFEKAMLWEMFDVQRNPIDLVEIKGVSKRTRVPTVLTNQQFHAVLERLHDPQRTMVMIALCTGLRVSEILALQWGDFDFEQATIRVTRAVVNGRVNDVKTEYSADCLPLDSALASMLDSWHKRSHPSPEEWVFANPTTLKPYHASSIRKRYFQCIAQKLGMNHLAWHTFRHTYRSWLDATGAPIGVQQKLMRHAQVSTTMNIYGNALMESKRSANSKVVRLVLNGPTCMP